MDVGPVSAVPMLHCCDTWKQLAARGDVLPNWPMQPATWDAIHAMERELLGPLRATFGAVELTYGFAGRELVKAIKARAVARGAPANVTPASDQHAGYELNTLGNRINKRDGIAVDLRVPGVSSEVVARHVYDHLPFDWMYLYGADRPFHLGWGPGMFRGVVRMREWAPGKRVPHMVGGGKGFGEPKGSRPSP